jgi:hypothetical protein
VGSSHDLDAQDLDVHGDLRADRFDAISLELR